MNTKPKRGLRQFYPTDKGPIDNYQLGHDGRIEYIAAEIATHHLDKGVDTREEWTKWAKERGAPTDQPGLVLSKRLGGSGIDAINLFPKSPLMDSTDWAKDEEKAYNESVDMKKWKKIKFFARLEYPDEESLRPSKLEYQYELPSGTILHSKISNDILPSSSEEDKNVGAEEEEESEYEYEYEEEEETQPQPQQLQNEVTNDENVSANSEMLSEEKERNPSPPPTVTYTFQPPPKVEAQKSQSPQQNEQIETLPDSSTSPLKSQTLETEPSVNNETEDSKALEKASNNDKDKSIFACSDILEMLPIVGSIKLAVDVVKAISNKDANKILRKVTQCGISVFADFHFMRMFARHGKILVKPITEKKLTSFANKAEPQIIIFGACKLGNLVLSILARLLS